MSRYPRSDVMSVSIPAESGGCGQSHSRPVIKGAPVKVWKLDCPPCEAFLSGERKPQVLQFTPGQPDKGVGPSHKRVTDADPLWSSTRETVALTPDQQKTYHLQIERGEQQLRALESIATLSKAGVDFRSRPDVLFYLREQELPESLLQGTLVCANGHDVAAGNAFCGECGVSMAARGALAAAEPSGDPEVDLGRLHPQTLAKMCRERDLPDKGSKDVLIGRLQAA